MTIDFKNKLRVHFSTQKKLLQKENHISENGNGIFDRWVNPVITADHVPLHWRFDLEEAANPFFMERQGINATFNAGAILWKGMYLVCVRIEGVDRKSFFAIAESPNGVDNFIFWNYPITMPETNIPDTNIYDMRICPHEDGNIYGLFCTERQDNKKLHDPTAAIAKCGIARTKDLITWERLPDLVSNSGQQRNVVLHPEFVDGKYGLYTRPQDGFISVGSGGGIAWGLSENMEAAEVHNEQIIDKKIYHTIKEVKNGQGPQPIKTSKGWLHLAHGVRNTAAGLRYVLYLIITDLEQPWVITHAPAGHIIAPKGDERIGDVSNVVFCNGWIVNDKNQIFIYYASSDTRLHVATSSVEKLIDYATNTPEDGLRSAESVKVRNQLIKKNLSIMKEMDLYG